MIGKAMAAIHANEDSKEEPAPVQNPQRIATESAYHRTLYMPSRLKTADGPATAIKVVAVPKATCPLPGLPATTLLLDEDTGLTKAVVNAAELTGLRTAAASALATTILASPTSTNLVVFGSGTQAYYHARLIIQLFPSIKQASIVVRKITSRATDLVERLRMECPSVEIEAITGNKASEVVMEADIICTCVPSTSPVFDHSDLKPGVHINAIGSYTPSMLEFPPALIAPLSPSSATSNSPRIPTILVDSPSACLSESGELIASHIPSTSLISLGSLLCPSGTLRTDPATREKVTRLREEGRSLYKSVGVGGMDVSIARVVVDEAERRGLGMRVPF
ncbi:ornithine cyclodeaminase [Rhodotorula toruloides]|uniref:Ornithine cyclodeaminase n=1 Tax=Rhodotorula toruloides TaxID=5286 RepID=A0A511KHS8_RHOTO|nr:ornithine cyclodeaminase [Rhodotorula toruloides]